MKLLQELLSILESYYDDDDLERLEQTLEDGIASDLVDELDAEVSKILGVDSFRTSDGGGGGHGTHHDYVINLAYKAPDIEALRKKAEQMKSKIEEISVSSVNEFIDDEEINDVSFKVYEEGNAFYQGWGTDPILLVRIEVQIRFEDPESFRGDDED